MNYKAYAPKKDGVNLETRHVRKHSRREKFAFNKSLHSARAKQERNEAQG